MKSEKDALRLVSVELKRARSLHLPFSSEYEGFAVILKQTDELWEEIKNNHSSDRYDDLIKSVTKVAAISARFLVDLS